MSNQKRPEPFSKYEAAHTTTPYAVLDPLGETATFSTLAAAADWQATHDNCVGPFCLNRRTGKWETVREYIRRERKNSERQLRDECMRSLGLKHYSHGWE